MTRWPRAHVLAAVLLALGLIVIATSTRTRTPPPRHAARYADVSDGRRLRYVRAGTGPAVVLVHGYGESLIAWRGILDGLAERHDVIAMDLPGFGLSSKPVSGYGNEAMAGAVLDLLDTLGVERFAIVGHSLGGAVSAAVTVRAPARVTQLVLLDAALVGPPPTVPDTSANDAGARASRAAIAAFQALRTRFTAPHDPLWLAESDSAAAYLPAEDSVYLSTLTVILREFDFAWLTPERAARMTMPVSVVWGEFDRVFSPDAGRALAARLPGATFEIIPRTWHRPLEERPAATLEVLNRLLSGARDQNGRENP